MTMIVPGTGLVVNQETSRAIWRLKYRWADGGEEDVEATFGRVARAVAAVEAPGERQHWESQFAGILTSFAFLPGGRILAGAGTGREVTLFNCFVMGRIGDSIPGIFGALNEAAQTLQQGGGIGHDFSSLRPRGALVKGVGAEASGPLSFMDVWDAMCRTIMSAGARRGAMMGTLRCDHPDILDFVDAKRERGRLRNFNLSVLVTDAFMAALEAGDDWHLQFGGETFGTVKAADLWNRIMRANYDGAEPGVIFIDRVNRRNPLSYCETISCTNPCGEQPLPPYGACLLGSINLVQFVRDAFSASAHLDLEGVIRTVRIAVRFLDNVIGISRYPLEQQQGEAIAKRRMGLGLTGLADSLAMLGLRYGSPAATKAAAAWMKAITGAALEASCDLAAERGPFPLFEASSYLETEYGRGLADGTRQMIRRQGLRNGLLTSIAPTGTISLLAGNVSSGIEPIFSLMQERKVLLADGSRKAELLEDYASALARRIAPGRALGPGFVTVSDLEPADHLAMQEALQPHVDSSISKTINVPESISFEDFKSVYRTAFGLGLKGCTTFRPNAITGSVLTAGDREEGHCPSCGSTSLIAREGCTECVDCGLAYCG
jgi:ribonucleoside-diphosphate reductase alpha chain